MANGHIVANLDIRFAFGAMQAGTILDGNPIADANPIDIAANHSTIPHAALATNYYVTNYGSRLCHKGALSNPGPIAMKLLYHVSCFWLQN